MEWAVAAVVVGAFVYAVYASERERRHASAERAQLLDHLLRVQRREAGMPELPRQRSGAAQAPEPIPDELEDLVSGFSSEVVRNAVRAQLHTRRATGSGWEALGRELRRQLSEAAASPEDN